MVSGTMTSIVVSVSDLKGRADFQKHPFTDISKWRRTVQNASKIKSKLLARKAADYSFPNHLEILVMKSK